MLTKQTKKLRSRPVLSAALYKFQTTYQGTSRFAKGGGALSNHGGHTINVIEP